MEELSEAFQVRTAMENDADAAALGEARWGAARGKGKRCLLNRRNGNWRRMISTEKSIEAGTIPIRSWVITSSNPSAHCAPVARSDAGRASPRDRRWSSGLQRRTGKSEAHCQGDMCFSADWRQRSARCRKPFGKVSRMGLANIVSILTPDAIVLGGSVMQSADLFLDQARSIVAANCRLVPSEVCDIAVSSLGADIGVIGAAQVWHNRFQR